MPDIAGIANKPIRVDDPRGLAQHRLAHATKWRGVSRSARVAFIFSKALDDEEQG